MKIDIKYFTIVCLIYIGVLWPWLQYSVHGIFTYWDEGIALLAVPVCLVHIYKLFSEKNCRNLIIAIGLFCLLGLMGNAISQYGSTKSIISDLFINIKFFLILLFVISFYKKTDVSIYQSRVNTHIDILSLLVVLLFIVDCFINIFPIYEIRFGIPSRQLFFSHPTFCAASLFYLLMLRIVFSESCNSFKRLIYALFNVFLCLIIMLTLRFKAIASVILFIAIYIYTKNRTVYKLRWVVILMGIIAVAIISYEHLNFYFTGYGLKNFPRGALLLTSFELMIKFFPFGSGFGTFGSYMSGVEYSPVYDLYGISHIDGITRSNYNAITDQYWPMVLGQIGALGIICVVVALYTIFKCLIKCKNINNKYYIAGLSSLMYIIISSTSESAICNPANIPFAVVIGLVLSQLFSKRNNKEECV